MAMANEGLEGARSSTCDAACMGLSLSTAQMHGSYAVNRGCLRRLVFRAFMYFQLMRSRLRRSLVARRSAIEGGIVAVPFAP